MERHWILVQNALTLAVLVLGWKFPGPEPSPWFRFLAGLLLLAGAALGISGVVALGPNRSPHPRPPDGSRLVQHGIYRRVRHPLYGSLMLLAAGWALTHLSWPATVAGIALGAWLRAKADLEEHHLRALHPGYGDYARRTRRFIPFPGFK
jgi:protein-S-isoprenylcysteine O-methyltransferase Ste14